jgi:hypothetical protein
LDLPAINNVFTWNEVSPGIADRSRATTPATWGQAMLVQVVETYVFPGKGAST